MGDGESSSRKRKNQYFASKGGKQKKTGKHKRYDLQAGMVGFLATLNDKQEKQATTELLNILPDFLPDDVVDEVSRKATGDSGGDDVAALVAAANATSNLLRFCETRVPNIAFIRVPNELAKKVDLSEIAEKVYKSVETKHADAMPRSISRYVLRLVPVVASCPAYYDRVNKCLKDALTEFIQSLQPNQLEQFQYFSLSFKSTYNQSVKSQEAEDLLVCHMAEIAPSIRLSRTARENVLVVGVHIVKTVCCISFLRDYYRFAKYNLAEYQARQNQSTEDAAKS